MQKEPKQKRSEVPDEKPVGWAENKLRPCPTCGYIDKGKINHFKHKPYSISYSAEFWGTLPDINPSMITGHGIAQVEYRELEIEERFPTVFLAYNYYISNIRDKNSIKGKTIVPDCTKIMYKGKDISVYVLPGAFVLECKDARSIGDIEEITMNHPLIKDRVENWGYSFVECLNLYWNITEQDFQNAYIGYGTLEEAMRIETGTQSTHGTEEVREKLKWLKTK